MSTQINISPVIKLEVNTTPITGGSAGQILFQTTGNTVGESANLFWDNTNNRLGIGTSSPQGATHIAVATGTPALVLSDVGAPNTLPTLQFRRGPLSAYSLQIDFPSNNKARFQIGDAVTGYEFTGGNIGLTGGRSIEFAGITGQAVTAILGSVHTDNNNGQLLFSTRGSGTISERARITNTGNVLIGTTTDAGFKLDVNGNTRINGDITSVRVISSTFRDGNNNTYLNNAVVNIATTNLAIGGTTVQDFTFTTKTSGGKYVFNNANVLINTTTDDGFKLDVNGTARVQGLTTLAGTMTASGAIARNGLINGTLVAAANNDVLVGLDIAPTFTNGAFTGVDNFSLRINGGKGVIGTTSNTGIFPLIVRQSNYSGLLVQNSFTGTNHNSSYDGFAFWTNNDASFAKSLITNWDNNGIYIYNNGVAATGLVLFGTTNNVGINTTTDAGYKLDVNGTARVQGDVTSTGSFITNTKVGYNNNSRTITFNDAFSGLDYQGFGGHRFKSFDGSSYIEIFTIVGNQSNLRIGINSTTPNASAILDVASTNKGFLPPRMTTTQKNAIATPATGLMVYDTDLNRPCFFNGTSWITL